MSFAMSAYDEFEATSVFCPTCRQAMPVRKHLFLILTEGDKYQYRCARCNTAVGFKLVPRRESLTRLLRDAAIVSPGE